MKSNVSMMPKYAHPQEKRVYQRIAETLAVRFRFSDRLDSVWADAQTQNISEGGIFISRRLSVDSIGNIVHVDLQLEREGSPLRIICEVAWIKRDEEKAMGVGLKIIQIDGKHKQTYLTYIYKRIAPEKREVRKIKFLKQPLALLPDKERRCMQILDYIRRFGPVSKADICKQVNLNAMTAGKFIDGFLKTNLVFDCGLDLSSGGRRAQLFKLNKDFGLILGIDINQEQGYILGLVTDMNFENIIKQKIKLDSGDDLKKKISILIHTIMNKLGQRSAEVLGIGIGYDKDIDKDIEHYIEGEFDLPVIVEEGFHLESFAQSWLVRQLSRKSILYIHSAHLLSLVLGGDIYKPKREIEGKQELSAMKMQDKALVLIELLSPDVVYIAKRAEKQLPQLKTALKASLYKVKVSEAEEIKVLSGDFEEEEVVVLGAISLVMREVFVGLGGG